MANESNSPPLFVDLDGTLIKTDLLAESMLALIRQSPWMVFSMFVWLFAGKARFKAEIARRVNLDIANLPLQLQLVEYLEGEASSGRDIYLATAADRQLAEPVGQRVGLFMATIASDGVRNLRGAEKLKAILEITGGGPFDYAGNSRMDFPIWRKARQALVVNPGLSVMAGARSRSRVVKVLDDRPPAWRSWLKMTRAYQWWKNSLIAVPLLMVPAIDDHSARMVLTAFIAFSLIVSATWILKDFLELSGDRAHPRMCQSPLAAGNISLFSGVIALVVLIIAGLGLAATLSQMFILILLLYLAVTALISIVFRAWVIVDVMLPVFQFAICIIAGAVAMGADFSRVWPY